MDHPTNEFEHELAAVLLAAQAAAPHHVRVEVNVANSFGGIASGKLKTSNIFFLRFCPCKI